MNIIKSIVRDSILEELENRKIIDKQRLLIDYKYLKEFKASFVTLNIDNNLRGCIGSIIPHRILLEDIIQNAKSSAFKDPRFLPLTKEEFKNIDIEISLLTTPKQLEYNSIDDLRDKVKIGIDGVILKEGDKQATFLPQVWEQLTDFDSFFLHLVDKANLDNDVFNRKPEIYTYQVEKF